MDPPGVLLDIIPPCDHAFALDPIASVDKALSWIILDLRPTDEVV